MVPLTGEGSPYSIAILSVPGGDSAQIILMAEGSAPLPRRISSVALGPEGRTFDVNGRRERRGARDVLAIYGLPYEFRETLAGASELQLRAGTEIRARFRLGNPRQAVAAHRRCTAEISRQWGLDEATLGALRQRPASTNHFGLRSSDYPGEALRTATQGRVIVRIDVSPEGRATSCAALATSGSPEIDATTCRVIMARARFRPAIDAAGEPVAIRFVSTVTWLVPVRY
ncbi:MAG TPA: energy transducer TonB [Allosphingosinicella sp.]|nr:energy transducer TonB [Allosphingosinicella sp.]